MYDSYYSTDDAESEAKATRRETLSMVAGIGGVSTLLPLRIRGKDRTPLSQQQVSNWNEEAEVVILGYGSAGAAAAVEAAEAGADTLVLEKQSSGGGAAFHANGIMYFGGGTELQQALGVSDSPDNMFSYLSARYPDTDPERLRSFVDNSVEHYNWLRERDVPLYRENLVEEKVIAAPGGGLAYSGSSSAYPYTEIADPAQRGHKIPTDDGSQGSTGNKLFDGLDQAARDGGAEILYEVESDRLITNESGRIVGVHATQQDEELNVRATRSVVICTGGFDTNEDMVDRHAPEFLTGVGGITVVPIHDGLGIQMGQAVGANVRNMGQLTAYVFLYPVGLVNGGAMNHHILKGVLVNQHGNRFINEDRYGGDIGTTILEEENGVAYYVVDQAIIDQAGGMPEHLPHLASADSLSELANNMEEVNPSALESTVNLYNEHAANGDDPVFRKKERYVEPVETPPYHAFDIRAESANLTYQTHGGLETDISGRVIHVNGDPIPGLRAGPRTANSITGTWQESGVSLSGTSYFGRLAGRSAAAVTGIKGTEDSGTPTGTTIG